MKKWWALFAISIYGVSVDCMELTKGNLYVHSRRNNGVVIIGSNVGKIASGCFAWNSDVRCVKFEQGSQLECIDDYAFANSSIGLLFLPGGLEKLGRNSFYYCVNRFLIANIVNCNFFA